MNPTTVSTPFFFILVLVPLLAATIYCATYVFRRYTGLSREASYLALIGSAIACGVRIYYRAEEAKPLMHRSHDVEVGFTVAASGIFILFLVPFVLRLWGRWIGDSATDEERLPGLPGIRAWFSPANIFVGIMLVVSAWLGYAMSPLLCSAVVVALLVAYPAIRIESPAVSPAPAAEDLSAEREKILSMLEAGKLTPEESAELLQALGDSSRAPMPRQVPLTGGQRLMLIGAALVALGFFLPWFVINPGQEVGRVMQQMQHLNIAVDSPFGSGKLEMPEGFPFGDGQLKTPTMTLSGGDIQRGLGWATLLLALAAAFIPYVATTLDTATARTVRLLCLSIGGLIVVYLVTQNLRFVGVGLMIAVGGYVLEIAGAMRERSATV
jgi:hypothetical protein